MDEQSRLSCLSRELSLSPNTERPEEYIKRTLQAHGFFQHIQRNVLVAEKSASPKQKEKGSGITEEDKKRTTQLVSLYKEGKEIHKLKEPRNLFSRSHLKDPAESKSKFLPFWPVDVACLPRRPKFTGSAPEHPEPFYSSEHEVVSPKIRSGEKGCTIVYVNPRGPEKYFTAARAGPSTNILGTPRRSSEDITLVFESRFESGNLSKAVQVGKWDYELYLSFDLYTNKHTQWFYFSVRNMRKGQTYRFTIVNLYKAGSLYNEGMQPVMYSSTDARLHGVGWRRKGHNIKYFKTPLRRLDTKAETFYFGLTWSYTFEYENDICYFAHCYPYTYSDLQDYLNKILQHPTKSKYCKQRILCHTLAGNPVPLLTITSPIKSPEETAAKRGVVVTSRVHPGETNGSWMMKGLLDFLTGDSPDAMTLRDSFVFKVVPMMNPDGVIVGNYRCSLAGRDLNRNYRTKHKDAYPTVWHTKAMMKRMLSERDVVLYCDLHGHSRKQNVFIYGCDSMDDERTRLKSRVFPLMLSKNAPSMFSNKSSRFGVHKSKESTGRVVMWREMGITNSYTMEATFCGSLLGKMSRYQFRSTDLEKMGYYLCDTLLDYCDPDQTKVKHILKQLEDDYRASVLSHLASLGQNIPPGVDPLDIKLPDKVELESSDAGSDSSESDGPPVHFLVKKKKKKKLRSRRERNKKRKAIMKMSHSTTTTTNKPTILPSSHAPINQAPPIQPSGSIPSLNRKTDGNESGSLLGGMGEYPKNGGIPMFIQERIEERQKRKNESADEMDHVDAIAREFLKQGFPPPLTDGDPRSSSSHLSRNLDCPINITPMSLCESGRGTRVQSRVSSRTSLPQLIDSRSHGAFTSHYLANHLQDVMSTPPPAEQEASSPPTSLVLPSSSGTRNLANLSRLFRQLRPHLINSASERKIQQKSIQESEAVNTEGQRSPKKLEFCSFLDSTRSTDTSQPNPPRHSTSIDQLNSKQLVNKLQKHLTENLSLRDRNEVLHSSSGERSLDEQTPLTQDLPSNSPSTLNKQQQPPPEEKVSLEPLSSHSSLGKVSSGSTTDSWENLTRHKANPHSQPHKQVQGYMSGAGGLGAGALNSRTRQPDQLSFPLHQPVPHHANIGTLRNDHQKKLLPLPKSISNPIPQSTPLTPISEHTSSSLKIKHTSYNSEKTNMTNVMEHKHHVSRAVDFLNSRTDKRGKMKKLPKEDRIVDIEEDGYSSSPKNATFSRTMENHRPSIRRSISTDHTPFTAEPHPLVTAEDLIGTGNLNGNSNKSNNNITSASRFSTPTFSKGQFLGVLGGMSTCTGAVSPDEDHEYYSELEDNINNVSRRYHYVAPSASRMPPSRTGSKQGGREKSAGVLSMKISNSTGGASDGEGTFGGHHLRPSTNHSTRKPRPFQSKHHSSRRPRTSGLQ